MPDKRPNDAQLCLNARVLQLERRGNARMQMRKSSTDSKIGFTRRLDSLKIFSLFFLNRVFLSRMWTLFSGDICEFSLMLREIWN